VQPGRVRTDSALLAFAAAFFVFHHAPAVAGGRTGDWIDLATPFVVVATAGLALASMAARPPAVLLGVLGAVLYVDGHGIHLAANSIGHEKLAGEAKDVTHFWDESFGHIEWHAGWVVLIAALVLAEALSASPRRLRPPSNRRAAAIAVLLGFTLFTSTVEGGTWWLELAATAVFSLWLVAAPRPLFATVAAAFGLAAVLIGIWAVWHGGVPQFSEVGWL
jgi:hypothetical protein